jgi:uncharacterized membrane protein YedE/YeeE
MRQNVTALASGVLFAIGLSLSGMTQPSKVIAFLDFTGHWDPSLAFVIGGALVVYVAAARWAHRAPRPRFAPNFQLPVRKDVDAPLVAGAAIFGVGWGLAGYCPGPAVASLASLAPSTVVFVGSMAAGILSFQLVRHFRLRSPAIAS